LRLGDRGQWNLNNDQQLTLFDAGELKSLTASGSCRTSLLQMDSDDLQRWKAQVQKYQQGVRMGQPVAQGTLFELTSSTANLEKIDPLALTLHSFSFFRLPANGNGLACIYFVLDTAAELVLYIGETCKSNKRWRQHHNCKRYLDNYQSLHYQYGLKTAICMSFFWDVPVQSRARQQLELMLIAKWKSPFNKENWGFWSAPFI